MKEYILKKIYILVLISNTLIFANELEVFGKILNEKDKKPINNVNVFIENQNIGTTSDKNGYFKLSLNNSSKKNIKINIQIIGYENKEILINIDNENIDLGLILMNEKIIELESIDIYSRNNLSNQISDVLIAGSDLNETLKGNIASTLANHPNIGINSFGSVTAKPALRGFSGDRFLLTKDGIETGDLSQSSIDHAIALDMSEVNQIEIIRGPKSLIFGPNAIGGVVNTMLYGHPSIKVDKLHHKYIIGSESFNNAIYGNIMFYLPIRNNQINLFLSDRKTNNETSPIGILENTKSRITNHKLGVTHYINDNYLNFMFENFNMNYGIPPTSIGHINGVDILLLKNSYQFNYQHKLKFKKNNKIDLKYNFIDYTHVELVNNDTINNTIYEILDSNLFHVKLAKKTENINLEFSSKNSIFGSEYSIKQFRPEGFYLTPKTDEKQISFYGYNKQNINTLDIELLSSFRLAYLWIDPDEYNTDDRNANLILKDDEGYPIKDEEGNEISLVKDKDFRNISFSFGVIKTLKKIKLNSWFMYTMRPPRVEELYSDGPHLASYAFEIGNPNLKSENIYGIENSISYSSKLFNFSLITFYNYSPYYFEMTKNGHCEVPSDWKPWTSHPCYGVDWIDWGSGGLGWLHKYSSKGNEVKIQGLEIDLGYKIKEIKLSYNFSFVEGENLTSKQPLSYMNPVKQILSFNYKNDFINYKIRLSKIHPQNKLGEFETYTPGAFLTDFIIIYHYKQHNITIQLNNIFDEIYYNHLSRIKNISPEPGKNLNIVYKIFI